MLAQPIIDIRLSSGHSQCAVPITGVLPHVEHTFHNIYVYVC
jgi:hypothetical protein